MRDIRFRGKGVIGGEWVYGHYARHRQNLSGTSECLDCIVKVLQINILDWNRPGNVIASGKAAVEYRGCTFGVEWGFSRDFSGLDHFSNNCTLEVIGNVFDNPDLLEVADAKTDGA